ncbi:hypothetical protein PV328_000157 [Microctonus aethiopoides]|uniref:Uncharacterized protein n=1 Tax=Microctonus aethiopoides TaxID=144406 RepID=A0AA39FUZ5_9HYME|nr:hypothetical protein PV328_000157 [Microctonus aethiopoides]
MLNITKNVVVPVLLVVLLCVFVQGEDIKSKEHLVPGMIIDTELIINRATMWLSNQRPKNDGSWGNDTHTVLLALRLANLSHDNYNPSIISTELQLSSKQMELEIVLMLWRHREVGFSISRLAKYTLALNAMCMDPRQFHGHDLIGTLQHHEPATDYDFALTSLAVCSAEAHIRKRQIQRLLDIANAAQYHNVDTVAMVILALRCIVQDHRHRNLHHFVRKSSLDLAQRQRLDGGFGDLRTTALAMQALEEIENESSENWNKSAAIVWLINHQQSDGSFNNDIRTTAEIILGIVPVNIINIRTLDCKQDNSKSNLPNSSPRLNVNDEITWTENHSERSIYLSPTSTHINTEMNATEAALSTSSSASFGLNSGMKNQRQMVNVSYTIWIGTNESHHIIVNAPKNGTFYNVMLLAAEMSHYFQFTASEWPNGHYVHTLAGLKEEPMSYHYWLLYRLFSPPDKLLPPGNQLVAPGGVDDLEINDGEYYLFWYKKL